MPNEEPQSNLCGIENFSLNDLRIKGGPGGGQSGVAGLPRSFAFGKTPLGLEFWALPKTP
jgi:hypothetical protein